jgi:Zn-dependent protease
MLFALGSPTSFILLLVSFVVAVTVHGWVQSWAAHRAGEREPAQERRLNPDPRRHVDAFGAIGAAVSGTGWARQVELSPRRSTRSAAAILLSGTVANLLVAAGALSAYRLLGGAPVAGSLTDLQRGVQLGDLGLGALYLLGLSNLAVAVLSLVPLPPLPGGRLLFAAAPHTAGWQSARYRLIEQNIGTAVLLALLLIPLGGPQPLLPTLLDTLLRPILRPALGG